MVALGLFGFLCMRAGWDVRYLVRVLWHRDSSTSDREWKRAARVAPAAAPVRWREASDCARVRAHEPALERWLGDGGALALVAVHDGAIACEWYGNGGRTDRLATAFSISKTVTSLVLARAVAEHRLAGLDEPITHFAPELAARDPRFRAITLAALVDMRSGIAFDEDTHFPWVDNDAPSVYYASDLAATVRARPRIASPPGTFLYNDYAPNLIGLALEQAYGARLAPGPMQALWSELGAEYPAEWLVDDRGFAWHESGFVVTARDLARLGQLVVDGGAVAGHQVAPTAWIERSRDPAGRAEVVRFAGTPVGYRNGWWTLGDDLVAMGRHGQVMLVAPRTRTVIVRMGLDGHDETNIAIARRLAAIADNWL